MRKGKAETKLLFKVNSNDELQFFLELVQKILKNKDSIVETKLNSINIKLYGKRDEVELLSTQLKNAHGLVKSAFLLNRDGISKIDITLLSWITGYHVDKEFFSTMLSELNVGKLDQGRIISTTLSLKDLIQKYKEVHLTFTSVLPQEHKDIRKVITILLILFPRSTVEDLVRFGIENHLLERKNGKLIFRADKSRIIHTFKQEYVDSPKKTTVSELKKDDKLNILDGGKIIFKQI
ncbi:MAG: DUF2067 domain-containing protein [Methanobacteriota archaeon]|nr:MAG: DUF2067 domain-containing protein [Euryarchaeota archaeon]